MRDAKITRIPYPRIILKGDWSGIVYAIATDEGNLDRHMEAVEEAINSIKNEFGEEYMFDSLREVKRELVWNRPDLDMYCTLIELTCVRHIKDGKAREPVAVVYDEGVSAR